MNKIRIYIAGPLFSLAERNFNKELANALKSSIPNSMVSLPQERAKTIAGKPAFIDNMFKYCVKAIDDADIIVAVLDGPDVDGGTCVEIGYAYAHKKPIMGIRTDFRMSEDRGVNLMVSKACTDIIWLPSNSIDQHRVFDKVIRTIKHLLPYRSSNSKR